MDIAVKLLPFLLSETGNPYPSSTVLVLVLIQRSTASSSSVPLISLTTDFPLLSHNDMPLDAVPKDTSTHTNTIAAGWSRSWWSLIQQWIGQEVKEDIQSREMKRW